MGGRSCSLDVGNFTLCMHAYHADPLQTPKRNNENSRLSDSILASYTFFTLLSLDPYLPKL